MEENVGKIITDPKDIAYALKHIQESKLTMHGHVWTEHYRKGVLLEACDEGSNTFTTEGMANILNTYFKAATQPAHIYCGIFKGNVTPALTDTAAGALGTSGRFTECLDADYGTPATNRPEYVIATTTTAAITNTASKAEFTIAGSIYVYGAFLATSQAKTATTGTLICGKRFTTSKACEADDQLAVTYGITMTTS
jgi:hypothetical protein